MLCVSLKYSPYSMGSFMAMAANAVYASSRQDFEMRRLSFLVSPLPSIAGTAVENCHPDSASSGDCVQAGGFETKRNRFGNYEF
jgi:hypothetical protein